MKYVQYGSGPFSNPEGWINFDSSPTLKIQNTPIIGYLLKPYLNVKFKNNISYGDILKGLPNINNDSCDGIFCSHVLEHLSLDECKTALKNTYNLLKTDGIFRCIVPDLHCYCLEYIQNIEAANPNANHIFLSKTLLGKKERDRSLKSIITNIYGNANHQYMWDKESLIQELKQVGFKNIRVCYFNDSKDSLFNKVEDKHRFDEAIAIEAIK